MSQDTPGTVFETHGFTNDAVGAAWDRNVQSRARELESRTDLSYRWLCNWIMRNIPRTTRVLDVGCGLGFLSRELAVAGNRVTAVDLSLESIAYARAHNKGPHYVHGTPATLRTNEPFDVVVLNMVLQSSPDLTSLLSECVDRLSSDGIMLVTIPHPWNYLQRRLDRPDEQFSYGRELAFEIPFRIHGHADHPGTVPFFHRSLAHYYETMRHAGLQVDRIEEPDQVGLGSEHDVICFIVSHYGTTG